MYSQRRIQGVDFDGFEKYNRNSAIRTRVQYTCTFIYGKTIH